MAYRPKQAQSAYQMLTQLLNDPTHYDVHFTACVLNLFITPCRTLAYVFVVHRFSASVVMAVTYGCDMKEGETFVASMRRSAAMVLRFSTPEISAICTAFPFGGCLPSCSAPLDRSLRCICHSHGFTGMVSRNGVQVRSTRISTSIF